jgi:hypothetical protein
MKYGQGVPSAMRSSVVFIALVLAGCGGSIASSGSDDAGGGGGMSSGGESSAGGSSGGTIVTGSGGSSAGGSSGGTIVTGGGGSTAGGSAGSPSTSGGAGETAGSGTCDLSQVIEAASYDQSCVQDSDCVAVGQGSVCYPCIFACSSGGAINESAVPQYQADVASNVPGYDNVGCGCPEAFLPCCSGGVCHADATCSNTGVSVGEAATASEAGAPSDASTPTFCVDGGTDQGCLCDYAGNTLQGACSVEGLECGLGCKPHCTCINGQWGDCLAPPC